MTEITSNCHEKKRSADKAYMNLRLGLNISVTSPQYSILCSFNSGLLKLSFISKNNLFKNILTTYILKSFQVGFFFPKNAQEEWPQMTFQLGNADLSSSSPLFLHKHIPPFYSLTPGNV